MRVVWNGEPIRIIRASIDRYMRFNGAPDFKGAQLAIEIATDLAAAGLLNEPPPPPPPKLSRWEHFCYVIGRR